MLPIVHAGRRRQLEEANARRALRLHRRHLRVASNPFTLPNTRFIELFRLNQEAATFLINQLNPVLREQRYRCAVSNEIKVLSALLFYATGSYQRTIGEDYHLGLSQTMVHRCISEVSNAIDEHLGNQFIIFPTTPQEINEVKRQFMERFQFPGIIGAIDGTHIAILKPSLEEHNFINRKGFHSLNIQIICDSNLKILNINANYGGSSHDAFIWSQSSIKNELNNFYNNQQRGFWLVGDSGYPLQPFLMTPFYQPQEGSPELEFNRRHMASRNCIERCIGLLKARFRCLLKERVARYSPEVFGKIINSCAVLHNICLLFNVPHDDNINNIEGDNGIVNVVVPNNRLNNLFREGERVRQDIVNRYML